MAVGDGLPKPWTVTPCIYSAPISRVAGCNIYLKLDNLQPSGSFKSRGIGNLMLRAAADAGRSGGGEVHFYCSSGGNAGLACATTALALQRKATIVVPTTTPPHMVQKLRDLGADVRQTGDNWAAADKHLRERLLAAGPDAGGSRGIYVPPFDHALIWEGVSTLVDELAVQMRDEHGGAAIDGIVCNVGGGGLLCGIMEGVERLVAQRRAVEGADAPAPRVLAMETEGAESLNASVRAGELVTLPAITSIATSLGATRVADKAYEWAVGSRGSLVSAVVSDAEAVMGVARFLDDAKMLVEVGCGASLVTAYNGDLRNYLGEGLSHDEWARKNMVLVVCGGSNMSLEMLQGYRQKYGASV